MDAGESSASRLSFILHRKQFPVILAFVISINKLKEQSLDKVGIYVDIYHCLAMDCNFHLASSRCGSKIGLKFNDLVLKQMLFWKDVLQLIFSYK